MIIFITGATSGIGKAAAYKFAEHGWDIIINGRREDRLKTIEEEIKNVFDVKVFSLPFDVRNRKEVEQSIHSLPRDWKKIDVLLNNAGLASGLAPIQEGDIDDWEKMIDTNLKGLLYVTHSVLPFMIEKKKGHIINLGSLAGKETYAKGNVYSATKFAVDGLSKSMRIDLLEHGIKVTSINPGLVETEFSIVRFKGNTERAKSTYSGLEPLKAEDIAEIIYFAASRPHHVVLNEVLITPLAQAGANHVQKKIEEKK
jgi:3-hydroxy acid dehydrogenase/malonic semialdehyde reductase